MLEFFKNLMFWRKEEEKESYPYKFFLVKLNDVAKSKGIIDDYNREIEIFENGEKIAVYPYTKELVNSIKQTEKIPGYFETYNYEEDDFEFYPFEDLDVSKYRGK